MLKTSVICAMFMMHTVSSLAAEKESFPDVLSGKWYTSAILCCVKEGIMSGYSESNFGTSDIQTREQGSVILAKAVGMKKLQEEPGFPTMRH